MGEKLMNFGGAIEALKAGTKVARRGWNGKGMYLKLVPGYPVNGHLNAAHPHEPLEEKNPDGSENTPQGNGGQMLPHIVLKIAGNSSYWGEGYSDYVPWYASQMDMLANDWEVIGVKSYEDIPSRYTEEITEGIEESKLSINFGKNGYGLTDELITIGKRVKELSKYNLVYLADSFIDTLDDVYQLTFTLVKKP